MVVWLRAEVIATSEPGCLQTDDRNPKKKACHLRIHNFVAESKNQRVPKCDQAKSIKVAQRQTHLAIDQCHQLGAVLLKFD